MSQLVGEMLSAAKSDDAAELQRLIKDTEIPNYENWFTSTFGQEKGESWAGPYGQFLEKNEKEFQEFLVQLAHQDGEVSVRKLDTAKKYDTLVGPLDEYLVDWKKLRAQNTADVVPVGFFYFIDGKFRWNSTVQFLRASKRNAASFVPGKIIKQISPEYPKEARQKAIEGRVVLDVILRNDGTVTVQGVAEGDPILSPAAIDAVRQWRYEPTLVNGQPVEVQTKITVTFVLNH